jgi:hypothetical protein
MMNKYTMLAVVAGLSLGGEAALAQTPNAAPANPEMAMPEQCLKLQHAGFVIKHETVTRSGTASAPVATHPRAGSYAAPRKYGEGGDDKYFIDSFAAHPKEGCRVCGVTVAVKGNVSQNSLNNDSVTLVGSNTAAPQVVTGHFNTAHTKLGGAGPLPNGAYSASFAINGPNWMNWYMASLVPSLDVMVQDDTTINSIVVTYYYY